MWELGDQSPVLGQGSRPGSWGCVVVAKLTAPRRTSGGRHNSGDRLWGCGGGPGPGARAQDRRASIGDVCVWASAGGSFATRRPRSPASRSLAAMNRCARKPDLRAVGDECDPGDVTEP